MNRAERRARLASERARLAKERPTAGEREALRKRELAALARAAGTPIFEDIRGMVLLVAEDAPPALVRWDLMPTWMLHVGLELHEDVIAAVEARLARGEIPALTMIQGWMAVHGACTLPLSPGGQA